MVYQRPLDQQALPPQLSSAPQMERHGALAPLANALVAVDVRLAIKHANASARVAVMHGRRSITSAVWLAPTIQLRASVEIQPASSAMLLRCASAARPPLSASPGR